MLRIIIVTNPAYDTVTEYLSSWSDEIIASISSIPPNTEIFELKKGDVTKEKLTRLVEEKNPHLILFNGHGSDKLIGGFKSNILVTCNDNENLLNGKIVYSLTCDSGKELGHNCIAIGTRSFIGYKEEFKLVHTGKTTSDLQYHDPIADLFLRPAFEVSKALLEGETVKTAFKRSQKLHADNLELLLLSSDPNLNTVFAGKIYHNMIHQVALGDQNASF